MSEAESKVETPAAAAAATPAAEEKAPEDIKGTKRAAEVRKDETDSQTANSLQSGNSSFIG